MRRPRTTDPWFVRPLGKHRGSRRRSLPRLPCVSSWFVSGGEAPHHLSRALPVHREADQLVVRVAHLPPAALRLLDDGVGRLLGGYGRGVLWLPWHRRLHPLDPGRPAGQLWLAGGLRVVRWEAGRVFLPEERSAFRLPLLGINIVDQSSSVNLRNTQLHGIPRSDGAP